MARVKNYVNDTSLSNDDRLFGTDGAGGINTNANFTLGDLKEFINTGVDIVAKTPKFHVPVINEASDDATAAGLRVRLDEATANVNYFAVDPDPEVVSDNKQIQKGVFRLVNDGSGWLLEVTNYTGVYHLDSFVGKSFSILAGPGEGVRVTGTLGSYLETDEKDYVIDDDGDVVHSLYVTRTGDLQSSWALLTSARTLVTELLFLTSDNDTMPNRITIVIDGDTEMGNAFVEELTALAIILPEDGTGLTFGDPEGDNYFTMGADENGNLQLTGVGDAQLLVDAPTQFNDIVTFNEDITVAEGKNLTFLSDEPGVDDGNLVINHLGISHTLHAETERFIVPVDANDAIDSPSEEGVITSIQIGTERYTIPTSASAVAQTLPGLYEALSPVPGDVVIDSIRQHTAGRYNPTQIMADDSVDYVTWATDIGTFSLLVTGSEVVSLGATAFAVTGLDNPLPITTVADQANANYLIAVTPNEDPNIDFGGASVGDEIRVKTSTDNFIQYNITSIATQAFVESGEDKIMYLFGIDTYVAATTPFVITQTFDYAIQGVNTAVNVDITTGTWYYGIDRGTNVTYKSAVAVQPTALDWSIGDTGSVTLAPDTALQTAFQEIPVGERLLFVDDTNDISALIDGDTVPGNSYEVVAYVHDNPLDDFATISFSRVGDGNLHISTPTLTLSSIPEATGLAETFLVLNDDDEVEFTQLTDVAGVNAQVNYVNSEDTSDAGVVRGIDFVSGPNNHNLLTGGGNLQVDITGKIPVNPNLITGSGTDVPLEIWSAHILENPSAPTTLNLPATADLQAGDTIRLINLSDLDPDGEPQTPTDLYSVSTQAASERIMKDLTDLLLDDIETIDLVWSDIPNVGWIIQ